MAKISKDKVKEIAYLSRIEISEADLSRYQVELSKILDYVETIQKVDTEKVIPTAQTTGLIDVWRDDKKQVSKLTRDKILSNVPNKKEGYIKVKSVLE